jgi:hypothetical protein
MKTLYIILFLLSLNSIDGPKIYQSLITDFFDTIINNDNFNEKDYIKYFGETDAEEVLGALKEEVVDSLQNPLIGMKRIIDGLTKNMVVLSISQLMKKELSLKSIEG